MTESLVACPYCMQAMAVAEFAPWTARPGLLSATCNCGRIVTRAEISERVGYGDVEVEVEDYELASARLEWARATGCLDLPAQRAALDWHLACCEAAYARLCVTNPHAETS